MSEQTTDTAPVTTTETAPEQKTAAQTQTQETKTPSLLEVFKSKAPEGAPTGWLEKLKDDEGLIKTVYSAQSLLGKKGDIPAEDAPDEVRQEFWKKLGADKVAPLEIPDFGEEFGKMGAELKEYYGGVSAKVAEIAKAVAPTAKNVPDLMNKVLETFIKQDAENARLARIEQEKQLKAQFETVAKKAGLSVDQLNKEIEAVKGKYGWGNETSIAELLLTLAKETSNTNTLKEAYLHNTAEGLDTQFEHENAILIDMAKKNISGIEYDTQLAKVQKLIEKISQMRKK